MKSKNIFFTSIFFIFGCASSPSFDTASMVQIITSEQTQEFKCERILSLNAIGKKSMTANADRRNAIIELTNKAKEAGANAVVVTSKTSSKAGIKISGHALDCVNLN